METSLFSKQKTLNLSKAVDLSAIAVIFLFFSETSYYLLILQTGIVDYFHSNFAQIWMIPTGGILGILTISKVKSASRTAA